MKRLSVVVAVVLIVSVLLSACGGAPAGPAGAIQGWLTAFTKFDFKAVTDMTCAAQKDQVNQALSFFSGSSGADLSSLSSLFSFDFSKLTFQEKSNDGKTAVIHVGGQMITKVFGQDQSQDMDEDLQVVNEGGQWKVCGNPLGQ